MQPVSIRRRQGLLILAGVLLVALGLTRSVTPHAGRIVARACPPGFLSGAQLAREQLGERRAEVNGARVKAGPENDALAGGCRRVSAPERPSDLMTAQQDTGKRARGGLAAAPASGAYAAAVKQAAAMSSGTLPGSAGTWEAVGSTPLVADDQRFGEVSGEGLADLNGRIADYAYDAAGNRLFAAVGEGGVWESDDRGAHWHSIGDSLPTQAVGSIAYSGGTLVIVTGDNVFGGGGTFAGLGAYRSTDGGATWQKSTGVPDGVIAFKVKADPLNPNIFYAATGAGLFRSTDGGATFANVRLPVGGGCDGADPVAPCALANMVTDVVVRTPDPGASANDGSPVLAAVGWRAGNKTSAHGNYPESPGNGVYYSPTGKPGTFVKGGGFTDVPHPGRIEMGAATGPQQDHGYVYALVEDADKFNGTLPGDPGLDTPTKVPFPTTFGGVYVSSDFGHSWTEMENAAGLQLPGSGSALFGTACAQMYCPGIQSWYNQWIAPDPTGTGVPKRLVFGLEEVWAAESPLGLSGPANFQVVGPYFSGNTCLFLNVPIPCPTINSAPGYNTTTHPDQHAGLWIPKSDGGVTLVAGNDGGAYTQDLGDSGLPSADNWGRGANLGFHTLLPYDAQVAKDGTIYAGLQDNGELKIEPGGKQFETYGGDGTFSAVDPDNSNIAYESTPGNAMAKTTDGGKTWNSLTLPDDSYQFVNPFQMDPIDASHLLTAGTSVHETTDGGGTWTTVYDLGTRQHPGDPSASASDADHDPNNMVSALDVRGVGRPLPAGKATANFDFDNKTSPSAPGAGSDAPGTYVDKPFTIAPDEGNASATITVTWDNGVNDWDLYVYRKDAAGLTQVGSSAGGPPETSEQVVLSRPAPGDYVIRVRNYAADPTSAFTGKAEFKPAAPGDTVADGSAAYVAYCGYCDALNTTPFANGIATNVRSDGTYGKPGAADNWHIARHQGLPKRYITSVQMDPGDARTVYVTLAGYSRRWLRPGVLGADEGADLGGGHVYKSTDAGETFTDISGNLPDIPADFSLVRNGQLIVATDLGVFISSNTSGGTYERLGSGMPNVPVLSLETKPKRTATEPDVMIVATQGRGVYCYPFVDPGKAASATCAQVLAAPAPGSGGGGTPTAAKAAARNGAPACTASLALTTATAAGAGKGVRFGFTRKVPAPVSIDVFRVSEGRRVLTERLVARFTNKTKAFTWSGHGNWKHKSVGDGYYFVRYTLREASGLRDVRRLVLARSHGRWTHRPDFYGRTTCNTVRSFKLLRPVFGGSNQRPLGISVLLTQPASVGVTVKRGSKVIKRYTTKAVPAGKAYRLSLSPKKLARGDYRVTLDVRRGREHITKTLTSRRL